MVFRGTSWVNVLTYVVFTIVPIIMFSIILMMKMRENYTGQIERLKTKLGNSEIKANNCRNDFDEERERVLLLLKSQEKCRETLGQVSITLDALDSAFKVQWERSNKAEAKLQKTLNRFADLQADLVTKDNLTMKLQSTNDDLRERLDAMTDHLTNITVHKDNLENELGEVKEDILAMKTNTSLLEGEKKGLEKVLKIQSANDQETEPEEKAPTEATSKSTKIIKEPAEGIA